MNTLNQRPADVTHTCRPLLVSPRTLMLVTTISFSFFNFGYNNLNYILAGLGLFSTQLFSNYSFLQFKSIVRNVIKSKLLTLLFSVALILGIANNNYFKDIIRDIGSVVLLCCSYLFFKGSILKYNMMPAKQLLFALFVLNFVVICASIYHVSGGAGRYELRGELLPIGGNWLIFGLCLVYGFGNELIKCRKIRVLCIFSFLTGVVLTYSRTGVVQIVIISLFTYLVVLFKKKNLVNFITALMVIILGAILLATLLVNSEALNALFNIDLSYGLDDNIDPSIGWRLMENMSFIEMLMNSSPSQFIFGSGFGARMSLPAGVIDFNGNDSIPYLHNSYLTMWMKFGLIGFLCIVSKILLLLIGALKTHISICDGYKFAGSLMLLSILLSGITLHGLVDYGHMIWLGLALALIRQRREGWSKTEFGFQGPLL